MYIFLTVKVFYVNYFYLSMIFIEKTWHKCHIFVKNYCTYTATIIDYWIVYSLINGTVELIFDELCTQKNIFSSSFISTLAM